MKRQSVALIEEERCIGCTLCIDACPVDAIIGAKGFLHAVMEPWCIGCRLCVPPCPVDCIEMVAPQTRWTEERKQAAKRRAKARRIRISKEKIQPIANRSAIVAELLARRRRP